MNLVRWIQNLFNWRSRLFFPHVLAALLFFDLTWHMALDSLNIGYISAYFTVACTPLTLLFTFTSIFIATAEEWKIQSYRDNWKAEVDVLREGWTYLKELWKRFRRKE